MLITALEKPELKIETEGIRRLAALYRAIDHPARIAIMKLIHANETMSVMEISDKMQLEKEIISQHLGVLRRVELVHSVPRSKFRYYSLNYKVLDHVHYQFDP